MDLETLGPAALAALATGAGAPIWAGVIFAVINTVKSIPQATRLVAGRERLTAFVLAGILVVLAFATALTQVPPTIEIGVFSIVLGVLSWFNVGRLAMALHDDIAQKPNSLTGPAT